MRVEPGLPANCALVVVDTNVLLSAALAPRGTPAKLVDLLLLEGRLVFSDATFAELETRIWKPKFDHYLPIERRRNLLQDFTDGALRVTVPREMASRSFSRDPTDDPFIHTALAAGSTLLVTGDNDLLCLNPMDSLRILTPRAALDELERGASGGRIAP